MFDWKKHSDKIMAISATITAAAALIVAVLEVRNQQDFQKLSIEPYMELGNTGAEQVGHYAFFLANNGLGPAIIKSHDLTVDGSSVRSWSEAARITTETRSPNETLVSDLYTNRRIKASETIELFKITPYTDFAKEFHSEMNSSRVKYEICYCSIYEDCWKTVYGEQIIHEPVQQCNL